MCGIFGIVVGRGSTHTASALKDDVRLLLKLSEPRGREATGLAITVDGGIDIFRRALAPSVVLRRRDFDNYLRKGLAAVDGTDHSSPWAALGHCRLVTNGRLTAAEFNQPVHAQKTIGVHNGVVVNDQDVAKSSNSIYEEASIDSEYLFRLLEKEIAASGEIVEGVRAAYALVEGSASVAFFRADSDLLVLATNTGSLYWVVDTKSETFAFASERYILEQFVARSQAFARERSRPVAHLPANHVCLVPFDEPRPKVVPLQDEATLEPIQILALRRKGVRAIWSESKSPDDMRRCSRCILPESYPFMEFDNDGVCNYCNSFRPQTFLGKEALEDVLRQHRKADGTPDCIVALSGGRDSSYGLHLLHSEFGMTPLAYTYDWGLVTDIARRNQARVCGKLGVEHVIRADDIAQKRRFIRKNVEAWLKRPSLGMVPIIMAGDKMFLEHARRLRRETGVSLVIFCSGNELERCEFKIGFCGIRETALHEVFYRYKASHKARLASWYAKEFLLNPRYFNESFFDGLRAFYSAFLGKDDFLQFYHFVPWNEAEINQTLKDEYGWESSEGSKNTWRIGDGYTSFINFIYYTVAGFSEYDTFRSNQVRTGLLSRDEALSLAKTDNQMRYAALHDFASQIGLNLDATLLKINEMPKLY
jgi:glucosamine--fructose-6-phosphate aminotransferase (isomerizing)